MDKIITSASKIVFIIIALVACIAFLWSVITGKSIFDTKDFMVLAGMAFGFFFAYKGESGVEYAGK